MRGMKGNHEQLLPSSGRGRNCEDVCDPQRARRAVPAERQCDHAPLGHARRDRREAYETITVHRKRLRDQRQWK